VCEVILGDGGDRRRQEQLATDYIPTADSSGCAVSLGGDDCRTEARWYASASVSFTGL